MRNCLECKSLKTLHEEFVFCSKWRWPYDKPEDVYYAEGGTVQFDRAIKAAETCPDFEGEESK